MTNRWYLLKRRVKVAARFRNEHGWTLSECWSMSGVHQRHMLTILAALQADEAMVEQFVAELDWDLDTLTLLGAI